VCYDSFMQTRIDAAEHGQDVGPSMFFHGCRNEHDLIYTDLVQASQEVDALQDFFTAFSDAEAGGSFITETIIQQVVCLDG